MRKFMWHPWRDNNPCYLYSIYYDTASESWYCIPASTNINVKSTLPLNRHTGDGLHHHWNPSLRFACTPGDSVKFHVYTAPVWRFPWWSVVCLEATRKRPLSLSTETASKVLATESRDRSVRRDDVTSGEEEYDAQAHAHLPFDCSVCGLFYWRPL